MENKEGNGQKKMDPGWNDPPMLKYDAANPPPKSRITNKRVAFPLSGNLTTTSTQTAPLQAAADCVCEPPVSAEELYKKTKENFEKVLLEEDAPIDMDDVGLFLKKLEEKDLTDDYRNSIYLFSKYLHEHNQEGIEQVRLDLASRLENECNCPSDT